MGLGCGGLGCSSGCVVRRTQKERRVHEPTLREGKAEHFFTAYSEVPGSDCMWKCLENMK